MSPRGPEDTDGEGGFLRNWSRRKIAARRSEVQPEPEAAPAPEPETPDDEVDLSDLPALDEITAETDMRPFMRQGVPASLRSQALRRAWSLSSHIRDYSDPAVDYAWDWNAPGGVPGGGGALEGDSVRKMVSDIFRQKTPESAPRSDGGTTVAAQAEGDVPQPGDPAPRAGSETPAKSMQGTGTVAASARDQAPDYVEKPASVADLRRHGSARPSFDDPASDV